jgi:hypothetical protein
MLRLAVDDVDFLRGLVHVRRQVRIVASRLVFAPPKTGKTRDVPLPESVALRLAAHLEAWPAVPVTLPWREPAGRPETARLLFSTRSGRRWPARTSTGMSGSPRWRRPACRRPGTTGCTRPGTTTPARCWRMA